jgi:hypothetical protein
MAGEYRGCGVLSLSDWGRVSLGHAQRVSEEADQVGGMTCDLRKKDRRTCDSFREGTGRRLKKGADKNRTKVPRTGMIRLAQHSQNSLPRFGSILFRV